METVLGLGLVALVVAYLARGCLSAGRLDIVRRLAPNSTRSPDMAPDPVDPRALPFSIEERTDLNQCVAALRGAAVTLAAACQFLDIRQGVAPWYRLRFFSHGELMQSLRQTHLAMVNAELAFLRMIEQRIAEIAASRTWLPAGNDAKPQRPTEIDAILDALHQVHSELQWMRAELSAKHDIEGKCV